MKKLCWVYFSGGYSLIDMKGVFLDHEKALNYVADDLIKGNSDYFSNLTENELFDEANSCLEKVWLLQ